MRTSNAVLESSLRHSHAQGDWQRTATLLLEGYGGEIIGFLFTRLRDRVAAEDVFSSFTEDLWRGLPGFQWKCSARTWAYALAQHAASRYVKSAKRRRKRMLPLSVAGPISELIQRTRTATAPEFGAEAIEWLERVQSSLSKSEQLLLVLRLSRGLSWRDIAIVVRVGMDAHEADIEREVARLRKRFELLKRKLKEFAAAGSPSAVRADE